MGHPPLFALVTEHQHVRIQGHRHGHKLTGGGRRYEGAPAGIEKNLIRAGWSPTGEKIGAGGADGSVAVWDTESKKLLYKLPGHRGTVNDMRFSPNVSEPISKPANHPHPNINTKG